MHLIVAGHSKAKKLIQQGICAEIWEETPMSSMPSAFQRVVWQLSNTSYVQGLWSSFVYFLLQFTSNPLFGSTKMEEKSNVLFQTMADPEVVGWNTTVYICLPLELHLLSSLVPYQFLGMCERALNIVLLYSQPASCSFLASVGWCD